MKCCLDSELFSDLNSANQNNIYSLLADWLSVAKPTIEQRISRYATDEIHFNLMAIISDRITQAEQKIQLLTEVSLFRVGGSLL